MKKFVLFVLAFAMLFALTACSAPKAASTLDTPLKELVKSVIATDDLVSLPKADLEDVIGIEPDDMKEAVYLQDEGMGGTEVLVVRAADKDAAARVAKLLEGYLEQRRMETRNYAPDAYKLLEAAEVTTKNVTVALISAENAADATAKLLAGE